MGIDVGHVLTWTDTPAVGIGISIVSRRAAYVSNPPGVKETGGCLFFQPAQGLAPRADSGLRKVYESTGNCALLFPYAVTSRRFRDVRINQRIDSLPCPALFSMFPGRLVRSAGAALAGDARLPRTRIYQTTTIGPAGLCCWLDYAGGAAGGGEVGAGSG